MIEVILAFIAENTVLIGASAAIIAIAEFVLKPFRWLFSRFRKVETVAIAPDSIKQLQDDPTAPPKMHIAQFIAMRREMKADLETELAQAADAAKSRLTARIAELESQIDNPDTAFAEAQQRIRDLEAILERSGNTIGGDRLTEARNALEAGDTSLADEIFAEIEEARALEVVEAARAAFGRGEIAEQDIRWSDAARHYARASKLDETYGHLRKASEFAERAGNYATALRFSEDYLALARRDGPDHKLSDALNEHAINNWKTGRYPEAEALYREALEIDAKTIGKAHPDYAIHLNNLAGVVRAQGRYPEAEALYREALEIDANTIGKAHPNYAAHLNNLALAVRAQGRYPEAEALYREALEIDAKTIGKAHPDYATRLNNLASVVQAQGRYPEAEALYREALEIGAKTIGKAHPDYAIHLNNLAGVLRDDSRPEEARPLFEQALKIWRDTLPPDHHYIAEVEEDLANLPNPATT